MQVSLIPVANVDQIWPEVRLGFHKAVMATGGGMTTGDLWSGCRTGAMFLAIVHDGEKPLGGAVFRPDNWQTGRKLRCMALYGENMADWFDEMKAFAVKLAHDTGATSLVTEGRPGWAKMFPKAKVLRVLYEEKL